MKRLAARTVVLLCAALGASACRADSPSTPETPLTDGPGLERSGVGGFELWVVDQSNSPGLAYGGAIHVYDGRDLMGESAASAVPIDVVDLGAATAALCRAATGADPVRPHMISFNSTRSRAVLSFVASGHVAVFDATSREPVACLRASAGAGGARQAHAAIPSPDDSYILIANQNGKLLERIEADYATDSYALNPAATLNLATCTTPGGLPCQDAALRPDNAPICPPIDRSSTLAWVTLRGGGMFVVQAKATPMRIVGEYDRATVHPNGCGGIETGGWMYINSGGGTASNLDEFDVYQFPLDGYSASNPPNTPAPRWVFTADDQHHRDSHGLITTRGGRYLWMFDRAANLVEIFESGSGAHLGTLPLAHPDSPDPTPDIVDIAPTGNRIFVSLRGPTPLSGDPHASTGSTPGIGVIQVEQDGRTGHLKSIVRISNRDAAGVERADPHGIRVRVR